MLTELPTGANVGVAAGDIQYVVVNVETHDWLGGNPPPPPSRQNFIGRVVEMAWATYDAKGRQIQQFNCLLRPHGYSAISKKARACHGVTTKCAIENGSDARYVFAQFVSTIRRIPADGYVVAHNMQHEDNVLGTNLDPEGLEVWDRTPKCCTWDPKLLPIFFGPMYRGRKWGLKLAELHKLVKPEGGQLRAGAHGSLSDTLMAWDIFDYMKKKIDEKKVACASSFLTWDNSSAGTKKRKIPPTAT